MRRRSVFSSGLLAGLSLLFGSGVVGAQETVPCLIFTGNSDISQLFDLAQTNRVSYGENEMLISSKDSMSDPTPLLYSLFHHIEIGEGTPSIITGMEELDSVIGNKLSYNSEDKLLTLESSSTIPFSLGIFDFKGVLIATSSLSGGQTLSLEALAEGVYIAVASNSESNLNLKFIIK